MADPLPADRVSDSADTDLRYRRLVLLAVVVCCAVAAPLLARSRGWNDLLVAGLIRVGVVCLAAWLALPSIHRLTARSVRKGIKAGGTLLLMGAVVLLALRPRIFGPLLLLAVALTYLGKVFRRGGGERRA